MSSVSSLGSSSAGEMGDDLGGGGGQDLGEDFHFESDSGALQSILNHRGLTPRLRPIVAQHQGAMTPASSVPARYRKFEDRYDFFEGKNGTVFYRPSARFGPRPTPDAAKSGGKGAAAAGGGGGGGFRGFRRGLDLGPPKRMGTRKSPSKAGYDSQRKRVLCQTEKRFVPLAPLAAFASAADTAAHFNPARMSISERRPHPYVDGGGNRRRSRLPRPMAQKALDFGPTAKVFRGGGKENTFGGVGGARGRRRTVLGNRQQQHGQDEDFEFARPLERSPMLAAPVMREDDIKGRSMAELILMRESLSGIARESFSVLLRQSLSRAELDRMFEDDSTASFENLEKRLRTPKRKPVKLVGLRAADDKAKSPEVKTPDEINAEAVANDDPRTPVNPVTVKKAANQEEERSTELPEPSGPYPPEAEEKCSEEDPEDSEEVAAQEAEFLQEEPAVYEDPVQDVGSVSILQRSLSMVNLPEEKDEENEGNAACNLVRSLSEDDLISATTAESVEKRGVLEAALEAKRVYQEQQDMIEAEMLRLMDVARKRREAFKLSWGVSPRSINQKRTVKTMIVCQEKIRFSDDDDKQPGQVEQEEKEEIARIAEEQEASAKELEQRSTADQPAVQASSDERSPFLDSIVDSPVLGDLAPQPKEVEEESEADLSLMASLESRNIDWFGDLFGADASLRLQEVEEVAEGGEQDQEDDFSDDNEEVEMEITQIEVQAEEEEKPEEKSKVTGAAGNSGDPAQTSSADKRKKKAKSKSVVRFADPTTPILFSENDGEEEEERIKITVPLHIGGKSTNISFTERRRRSNVRLHQPTPMRRRKSEPAPPKYRGEDDEDQESYAAVAVPGTPAALLSISDKAQRELALLYGEEEEDDKEVSFKCVPSQIRFEDEEEA